MIIGKVPSVQEIGEARKQKVVVHMIVVYGDDSSDGKRKRVFAVAALIARQEAWDNLDPIWKAKTSGVSYHATDCLAGQKAYKGWSKEKRCSLHNDLSRLIVGFPIAGFAFVMDLASFAQVMHGTSRSGAFLYCFAHMVGGASALVQCYNTLHESDQGRERAKFVFDSDRDQVNAGNLFSLLNKMHRWNELTSDCTGSVEFAFDDKPVGIQAADLWAYEVRNEFDKTLNGIQEQSDASKLFSLEHGQFLKKEYFRTNIIEAKNRIDKMGGEPEYSIAYHQWLSEHRRRNNIGNQIAFDAYWDACLRRKENKREESQGGHP